MVVAQDVVHDAQVEQVVVARLADGGAAERRRVQDDPAPVREAVSRLDPRERPVPAGRVGEQVGPREPEARGEERDRLAERLRVERRDRHRGHEREAVVAVDRDHAHEGLVGAELPIEDAVAELLERAGRVPHLEPQRPRTRRDHVDREEVVVDDEGTGGGEVVAGSSGGDDRAQATRDAALLAPGEDGDRDRRVPRGQLLREIGEVSGQRRRMRRGEDHARRGPARRSEPEPDADRERSQPDDRGAHRPVIRSITRSVEPPSRWSKWRRANGSTLSAW